MTNYPCSSWPEVPHRIRDIMRFHALQALEARRPRTFSGPGGGAPLTMRHAVRRAPNWQQSSSN